MITLTNEQVEKYYEKYIECFNNADFNTLVEECLSEDLYFYRDEIPPLGREGMREFYLEAWQHWKETLVVKDVKHIDVTISSILHFFTAQLEIRLKITKDWIDGPYGTFYAKDQEEVFEEGILYGMDENGKIVVIL